MLGCLRLGAETSTPSSCIGYLLELMVARAAGFAVPTRAPPGDTGWIISLVAGSLFGDNLETEEQDYTYGGVIGLGVGRGVLRQLCAIKLLIGTGSLKCHLFIVVCLTPYRLLGALPALLSTGRAETETEVELVVDLGGGFWVRVTGPLTLRGDVRVVPIDNAPNFWRASTHFTLAA